MRSGYWSWACGWGCAYGVNTLMDGRVLATLVIAGCVALSAVAYYAAKEADEATDA